MFGGDVRGSEALESGSFLTALMQKAFTAYVFECIQQVQVRQIIKSHCPNI